VRSQENAGTGKLSYLKECDRSTCLYGAASCIRCMTTCYLQHLDDLVLVDLVRMRKQVQQFGICGAQPGSVPGVLRPMHSLMRRVKYQSPCCTGEHVSYRPANRRRATIPARSGIAQQTSKLMPRYSVYFASLNALWELSCQDTPTRGKHETQTDLSRRSMFICLSMNKLNKSKHRTVPFEILR